MSICNRCGKTFRSTYYLRRHESRTTPCDQVKSRFVCSKGCGRSYSHSSNLYRHQKTCKNEEKDDPPAAEAGGIGSPDPTIVVNNVTNIGQSFIGSGNSVNNVSYSGWPAELPPLDVEPAAFRPASFIISAEVLESVIAMCTPEQVAGCQKGDSDAVSAVLLEVMKRVHADARQRNVFLSPKRADHVLVFIPKQWEALPLRDAIRVMYDRVVEELGELTLDTK